jgi:Xaa-Pro aminopeptidase
MRQTFDDHADPSFGRKHLPLIRTEMAKQGLDGFLIPHEDEHQNEYLPDANERLAWATGFTGSAGAAVVMATAAAVFVDGRYTLQAETQTDPDLFERRDLTDGGVTSYLETAAETGQVIGYDPRLHSPDALGPLKAAAARAGAVLKAVASNPVDAAWGHARPPQPRAPVVAHALNHAGEGSAEKRSRIGEEIVRAGADMALITAPASIAWLYNIRGADVIRSPLPLGQTLVQADGRARLFLDPAKVTPDLPAWLGASVTLEAPETLFSAIAELRGRRVLVDPAQASSWYFEQLEAAGATVVRAADPCALPRAAKNPVEVQGARNAHIRDASAVVRFLHWLATDAQASAPDELEVVAKLEALREATGVLKDLSFDTIAGAGANSAIVHYRPTHGGNRRVRPGELLLVDSGGQYLDGTTDITRTVAIGAPSEEMCDRFTRVLKGHIALARIRFPSGTTGSALDVLARASLWMAGLDYDHGTGHGVGSYLSVHEGPHRISKAPNTVALRPGMIVSNEPGYYKPGAYGIRIENLQVVTSAKPISGGERPMLGFETLTLAPIDRRLIVSEMLSGEERAWLNAYHAEVAAKIAPLVEPEVAAWLKTVCATV